MEPNIITVTQNSGLIFDNRYPPGRLILDSTKKSGLTLGDNRVTPYEYETTGAYIGGLPPWVNPDSLKPWTPAPWIVPQVSPPQPVNTRYVYLSPQPTSPWNITFGSDRITLILDVPGVKPEDINVQIENMKISVTGRRSDNGFAVLHTWQLTSDYEPSTSVATMELGTLKLVIDKHTNQQTHHVKVTVVK